MNDMFSILIMGIPVTYSLIILGIRIFKRSAQSPFYVLAFRKTLLLRSVCVRRMFWSNSGAVQAFPGILGKGGEQPGALLIGVQIVMPVA